MSLISVEWVEREAPLPVAGIIAFSQAARALARRLLSETDEVLAGFRGVWGDDLLLAQSAVGGTPPPWVDGGIFLGEDPAAPGTLCPTWARPDAPLALVRAALDLRGPVALVPERRLVVPLGDARPIDRSTLKRWLAR